MKDATLCYVFQDEQVLLQKKAEGLFGGGKWNAPGGKIKFAESPTRAAIREVREETGLEVDNLKPAGLLNFIEEKGKAFLVHIFVADKFSGEPRESLEGKLKWFPKNQIPYDEMWENDSIWLPKILKNQPFRGNFLFSKGFKKMLKHEVEDL
ncbi:MAG: 8-oxo-dGTP diphosphatase [Candidatus Aenigmarchaeota archaeon]|nr:8-oxo-dGTP diphosphatase [Candidatus Aenigmarchaeota archaeon]